MSTILYNGIQLSFLSVQRVNFEPLYDEMASVDQTMTRVTILCTAVIAPGYTPFLIGETATDTMARVSHKLNSPRRGLIFTVGGRTLVTVAAPNGDTTIPLRDARNGPFTQANVTRIVGTESLMVQFRVETYVVDCLEATSGAPYVSFRYTEIAEINELGMSRRTRTGRLETRADILGDADQLRTLVVPRLEPDFRRLSSRYVLSPEGRTLSFEHVDEEVYLMPPNPAAKAEGHFSITSKDGAMFFAECFLRLQGGKQTDKAVLMMRAMSIALAKIQLANAFADKNGAVPIYGSMSEDIFANDVSVRLAAMVAPAVARMTTATSLSTPGGTPPNATATRPAVRNNGAAPGVSTPDNFDWLRIPQEFGGGPGRFDPGTRGSAQLLLLSEQMQDPCLRFTALGTTAQSQSIQSGDGQTVPATITIGQVAPDDKTSFRSHPDQTGIYEHYEIEDRFTEDRNIFALPVGKKDADAAVIQTAAPAARRRIEWKAIKVGGPPRVPRPELKDTNWILTKAQQNPSKVEPVADGSVLRYEVSGCCDYVAVSAKKAALTASPLSSTSSLTAAVPPWVDQAAGAFAHSPLVFADDIVEPGQSSFSTGGGGIIPGVNG